MVELHAARGRRGHAIVELSLLMPWLFFLFVGALDFGFYVHSLISVQNAARVAALYTAQCAGTAADQSGACQRVVLELGRMPNASEFVSGCASGPLVVNATEFTDAQGQLASRVEVAYRTVGLIPIPGLLVGQVTMRRTAEVKVFGD
jgi:Flp pilus assembly protein TadG